MNCNDYKQNCVLAMLECLESYDLFKGAEFLTYAHHAIGNALIQCRMMEETGEDVTRDDCWDYAAILWNGVQAEAVQAAFEKLTYREQRLLEERNAVCMTCGRVSPLSERKSFEELAVMFEGSTASGAERFSLTL